MTGMRILHIIDTLDFGGAEKVLVALANDSAQRHTVQVCCLRHSGVLAKELAPGIEVQAMGKGDGDDALLPWRLGRHIAGQFDVVHTHNWATFIEGGLAAVIGGIPTRVHTVHGPYGGGTPSGTLSRVKRQARHLIECAVATRFQHIVAVSDAIRHYIPDTVGIPLDRLQTIHNGIAGRAASQRMPKPAGQGMRFISVGRLDAIKNHQMMLKAFASVLRQHPNATLQLVGDGPCRKDLEGQAQQLKLGEAIEFAGFRSDIPDQLARADAFLLSSHYEGVSIAVLEAMRAGLPVIATDVGGLPETVEHGQSGLLTPDDDATAFAQSMLRLAGDEALRHSMSLAALAHQQVKFSLERMVQSYEHLYSHPKGPVTPWA